MMLHAENSIRIMELWWQLLLDLCVYVPFKGFAGNNLLSPTENNVQNRICLCKHHLGVKRKMEPTLLLNHYIPSPLVHLSFTLAAVTPQNSKYLSVRKPFINCHFSDFNDIFLY